MTFDFITNRLEKKLNKLLSELNRIPDAIELYDEYNNCLKNLKRNNFIEYLRDNFSEVEELLEFIHANGFMTCEEYSVWDDYLQGVYDDYDERYKTFERTEYHTTDDIWDDIFYYLIQKQNKEIQKEFYNILYNHRHSVVEYFYYMVKPVIVKYKSFKQEDDGVQDCCICIQKIETNELVGSCRNNHYLHRECLKKWLKNEKNTCPTCRERY